MSSAAEGLPLDAGGDVLPDGVTAGLRAARDNWRVGERFFVDHGTGMVIGDGVWLTESVPPGAIIHQAFAERHVGVERSSAAD